MDKAIKWQLGKISWFNDGSGKGVVKGEDGKNYSLHHSAIEPNKKGVSLKPDQEVRVQVLDDKTNPHVRKLTLKI